MTRACSPIQPIIQPANCTRESVVPVEAYLLCRKLIEEVVPSIRLFFLIVQSLNVFQPRPNPAQFVRCRVAPD